MVDYFIVGSGLAGIAFAETALQQGKTILVFDNNSSQSSKVAGGIYNAVILKRFSGLSGAQEQLNTMTVFYQDIEKRLGQNFNHQMRLLRKFASVAEQNDWFAASDKPLLLPFLSPEIVTTQYPFIDSPFNFGEVLQTGFVDSKALVERYQQYLKASGMLADISFDYCAMKQTDKVVSYNGLTARHVIFAEGFGIGNNPYFKYLPLDGTKGELLIVKVPGLKLDAIIKSDVFILPLGNELFKVGATYEWDDKTEMPTASGKSELIGKLEKLIDCTYEIIRHEAGIRPTVRDRKPLIGTHPEYKNLHVLNGLGTRGVMLGPITARMLFNHIESGEVIPAEINIERFKKAYLRSGHNP